MKLIQIALILSTLAWSCQPAQKTIHLSSPDGELLVSIDNNESGVLSYRLSKITASGETLILNPSPLGLMLEDADFTKGLKLKEVSGLQKVSDSYSMLSGKYKQLSYEANETVLSYVNDSGREIQIVFRMFDEGMAFRYIIPGTSGELATVKGELTGFDAGPDLDAWMSPYQAAQPWGNPGYEADYLAVRSGTPSTEEVGWSFPLLFQKENYWIFISESGLDEGYCGTHLAHDCTGGLYTIAFPEENERYGDGKVSPVSVLPLELPWRFILVGDSLKNIVESSMVYHLAEASKIEDISWIRPGRASWEWWSSKGGRTVSGLKKFIDLSDEMNWEYSLVDAGWGRMPDGTIDDVIDYADSKNVGLLFWYSSGGRRDSTSSNEDFVMFNDDSREKEMARLQEWGIKGIKVDFFATDKQMAIDLYQKIIRDAARHRLLVNFHGCTLPRGWTRTYPNLLTMEAVRGAECYRFSEPYPEIAPYYNTIAAVVRSTAGPADYTPATFSDNRYPHITTFGHELALTVVYESGIIHMADTPESYRSLAPEAIRFLKDVPAAWDESRLLKAVPGEVFIIARRKGESWYVAGINGLNETRDIRIEVPGNLNNGVLITDGDQAEEWKITRNPVSGSTLMLEMKPNGGFVLYNPE